MQQCWVLEPKDRPDFDAISQTLRQVMRDVVLENRTERVEAAGRTRGDSFRTTYIMDNTSIGGNSSGNDYYSDKEELQKETPQVLQTSGYQMAPSVIHARDLKSSDHQPTLSSDYDDNFNI